MALSNLRRLSTDARTENKENEYSRNAVGLLPWLMVAVIVRNKIIVVLSNSTIFHDHSFWPKVGKQG